MSEKEFSKVGGNKYKVIAGIVVIVIIVVSIWVFVLREQNDDNSNPDAYGPSNSQTFLDDNGDIHVLWYFNGQDDHGFYHTKFNQDGDELIAPRNVLNITFQNLVTREIIFRSSTFYLIYDYKYATMNINGEITARDISIENITIPNNDYCYLNNNNPLPKSSNKYSNTLVYENLSYNVDYLIITSAPESAYQTNLSIASLNGTVIKQVKISDSFWLRTPYIIIDNYDNLHIFGLRNGAIDHAKYDLNLTMISDFKEITSAHSIGYFVVSNGNDKIGLLSDSSITENDITLSYFLIDYDGNIVTEKILREEIGINPSVVLDNSNNAFITFEKTDPYGPIYLMKLDTNGNIIFGPNKIFEME